MYKMAKPIIIVIQVAVMISFMSCSRKDIDKLFQINRQQHEEMARLKKELEEAKKIKAGDGVDGKDGRDGVDGKDGRDGRNYNDPHPEPRPTPPPNQPMKV
jgi:hypothetical protein